jgi:iron complex outermembrane recepter protein
MSLAISKPTGGCDRWLRASSALIVLCSALASTHSQAQTLEEVIVTATKREQNIQDIPVTVTAISAMDIQEAGVNDIGDVSQMVPSLTVSSNISPFSTGIRIRGIGTTQLDPSLEASVAFILDGVFMGRSGLGMSDLTDIERIEVLQGPQGTLYGKNSNAGVISVITKPPNIEETEGYVEANVGDYDLQKYVGSVSGPITDSVAYRLSGQWHEHDGWLESDTGDDLNAVEDWNVMTKLLWEPTDTLSLLLSASHVERDTSCCAGDSTQTAAITDELLRQELPVPKNDAFDYKNNADIDSSFALNADAANLKINYESDFVTLSSLTAWNDYDTQGSTDAERSQLDVLGIVNNKFTGELFSQEFRLTSSLEGPWQYLAGLYFTDETLTQNDDGNGLVRVGADIVTVGIAHTGSPLFRLAVAEGDTVFIDSTWNNETFAVFGQTTYSFAGAWEATLGLRYTSEEKEADLFSQPFSTAPLFGTGSSLMEIAYGYVDDSFNRSSNDLTGLISLSYFVAEDIMVFATASTGSKSGGFNGGAGTGVPREYDDETTSNFELGVKSQLFENRLQLNATVFYTEFDDLQYLAQNPSGVGTFVDNGDAETQGVDVEFSAAPWPFLRLSGGLLYLDAKYTSGQLYDQGLDVNHAPDWSGALASTLLLPLGNGIVYLRGDYSFMDDHQTNAGYQTPETEQDKEIVNAKLGWRNDQWDASVWVKNATDEAYSSLAYAPLAFSGSEGQALKAPRTYGATLRYSF